MKATRKKFVKKKTISSKCCDSIDRVTKCMCWMIDRRIECITTRTKRNQSGIGIWWTYPRIKRPDKAGIRRRLFGSSTEAKANLAAVNVRNDSVVLVKIRWVICKCWFPSDDDEDVGSSPSIKTKVETIILKSENLTFSTNTNYTPNSCNHWKSLGGKKKLDD